MENIGNFLQLCINYWCRRSINLKFIEICFIVISISRNESENIMLHKGHNDDKSLSVINNSTATKIYFRKGQWVAFSFFRLC